MGTAKPISGVIQATLSSSVKGENPMPTTKSISIGLTIVGNPDFNITATPNKQVVKRGESVEYEIDIIPKDGFSNNVSLLLSGIPLGVTETFTTNPVPIGMKSILRLDTALDSGLGEFFMTLTGEEQIA